MYRLAIAIALALASFGCAADVVDPVVEPLPAEPQEYPPPETLWGELPKPYSALVTTIEDYKLDFDRDLMLPAKDKPPIPDPYVIEP